MKRKGFTLVELLVVIAIIALLMGILMPALARVRQLAYRMICGTHLSSIGKATLVYSNDWDEEYPHAGGRTAIWKRGDATSINQWNAPTATIAYGLGGNMVGVTITSSLYLLVKYADVPAKMFVCKGDIGTKEFTLGEVTGGDILDDATEAWDFGGSNEFTTGEFCSYAYHNPYNQTPTTAGFPVTGVSNPGSPLCADRTPYLDRNATSYLNDNTLADPYYETANKIYRDEDLKGNAATHQREGQNVLFNDSHVRFEKYPCVGIDQDNIYRRWSSYNPTSPQSISDQEKQVGGLSPVGNGDGFPRYFDDAYLVGEKNAKK